MCDLQVSLFLFLLQPSVEQPLKAADSWAIFVDINQPLETVDNMVVEVTIVTIKNLLHE